MSAHGLACRLSLAPADETTPALKAPGSTSTYSKSTASKSDADFLGSVGDGL